MLKHDGISRRLENCKLGITVCLNRWAVSWHRAPIAPVRKARFYRLDSFIVARSAMARTLRLPLAKAGRLRRARSPEYFPEAFLLRLIAGRRRRIGGMKKTLLLMVSVAAFAGAAQAQDSTTSYGPLRFGVTAGPATGFGSPFNSGSAARFEQDNPVNNMPWTDRANAAPSSAGPALGPEGSGTPMSRGGINDTLTGPRTSATFNAPVVKPKAAKSAAQSKSADAKATKP